MSSAWKSKSNRCLTIFFSFVITVRRIFQPSLRIAMQELSLFIDATRKKNLFYFYASFLFESSAKANCRLFLQSASKVCMIESSDLRLFSVLQWVYLVLKHCQISEIKTNIVRYNSNQFSRNLYKLLVFRFSICFVFVLFFFVVKLKTQKSFHLISWKNNIFFVKTCGQQVKR